MHGMEDSWKATWARSIRTGNISDLSLVREAGNRVIYILSIGGMCVSG